mmetsp:Transcript_16608/g.25397  ORF Transcript_16608/g.25397 Transcript_16608/m.25397 type:complete len:400 (+) Transcript_16608:85-1284(+)
MAEEELALLENIDATWEELVSNGGPADPLQFNEPRVGQAARVSATLFNPVSGEQSVVQNVVYEARADGMPPTHAYWIGRKIKKAIFGAVRRCTVLRFRDPSTWTGPGCGGSWEVTATEAAVKVMDLQKISELHGKHSEDPIKELAAMQTVNSEVPNPHVIRILDVLQDDQYLYAFMPFCNSGDLFSLVEKETQGEAKRFSEPLAQHWFKQILNGILHLQKMGICHRDMSLENILVDNLSTSVIIDMGMCLRVPYLAEDGYSISNVSAGTLRLLISRQPACGKPNYISPEVLARVPFDGFAIDTWAAGIMLFIMIVGLPPFDVASPEDPRYRMVTQGGLKIMLQKWNRPISDQAAHLLQGMLREHPGDRLTFGQVMEHPWVTDHQGGVPTQSMEDEGWRY